MSSESPCFPTRNARIYPQKGVVEEHETQEPRAKDKLSRRRDDIFMAVISADADTKELALSR